MKRISLGLALPMLCLVLPTQAAPAIQVIDATPAFVQFWKAAEGKSEGERAQLFLDTVVAVHPELFERGVVGGQALRGDLKGKDPKAVASAYLRDVAPYAPRMLELSSTLGSDLKRYAEGFTKTFPDYASATPVYFTVSMFNFDGGTRPVNGRTALLFGIDGIARYHRAEDKLSVLFNHELFHQYHEQLAPELTADEAPIWASLWEEGLATYVSQRMEPGVTEEQALFSKTLAAAVKPMLPKIARELLENLDSLDQKEYAAFFFGKNDRSDIPGRAGYYVGYLIAGKLGEKRSLQDLAALRGPELKAAIKSALEQMSR